MRWSFDRLAVSVERLLLLCLAVWRSLPLPLPLLRLTPPLLRSLGRPPELLVCGQELAWSPANGVGGEAEAGSYYFVLSRRSPRGRPWRSRRVWDEAGSGAAASHLAQRRLAVEEEPVEDLPRTTSQEMRE